MPSEHYDVQMGLQFVPGQAAEQMGAEIKRILREAQSAAASGGGILDANTADAFGERLGAAMHRSASGFLDARQAEEFAAKLGAELRRQVESSLRSGGTFNLLDSHTQSRLTGLAIPPNIDQFLKSQLSVSTADRNREMVGLNALRTDYGSKKLVEEVLPTSQERYQTKAYPDEARAQDAVEKAERAYATAVGVANEERKKFMEALSGAERKEQEALAQSTVAIQRNTDRAKVAEDRRLTAEGDQILAITKRTTAAREAAEAEEERVRNLSAAREARDLPVRYPGAASLPNEKLGAAQEAVNVAERKVASARTRLADVDVRLANEESTIHPREVISAMNELDQAMRAEASARRAVTQEERRAAALLERNSSGQLGLVGQFSQGFKGVSDRPFAEQIGQAFKFSVFYGTAYKALFALTQTFQQTLQEGILFENSVAELRLATGQTAESAQDLANQVGREASTYGFAPSAAVAIAARAQGYYGTTGSDTATQAAVGRTSARVVNQVAFASGGDPNELQGQIAAITQAYGLGYQSQQMIGDLDAYMSRKFGINPGETIGAIAESGTVGRAAGFSPAEVAAIAADIQARTGASPSATGGFLAQIFSRSGEGSLTQVTQKYGINQSDTFAEQLAALAKVYANASPNQRDEISAVGGRGKVQNAFIALLQDYPEVQKAAAKANSDAPGALNDATKLRLDNIGGQIQQFQGVLRQFANDLGQSGLLDDLGILVIGIKDLVVAADDILQVFNQIPRGGRDVIFALGALAFAAKAAAAAQGEEGAAGVLNSLSRGNLVRASTLTGERALVNGAGEVVPLRSVAGARTAAAGILGGLGGIGVAGAFLGDAILWSKTRDATERYAQAANDFADTVATTKGEDLTTPEGLSARASALKNAEAASRDAAGDNSGFKGLFNLARYKNLGADQDQALTDAAFAKRNAEAFETASKNVAAHNAELAASAPGATITNFDADALDSSLQAISSAGGTAKTQFDALASSLDGAGRAANRVASFDPDSFAATAMQPIFDAILKHPGFTTSSKPTGAGELVNNFVHGATFTLADGPIGNEKNKGISSLIESVISPEDIQKRLQKALAGVKDPSKLTEDNFSMIAANVLDDAPDKIIDKGKPFGLAYTDLPEIRDYLTSVVEDQLKSLLDGAGAMSKEIQLTADQSTAEVNRLVQSSQGSLSLLATTDYKGRSAQNRELIRKIRQTIAQTAGGATPVDAAELAAARRALAETQFDQLEAERKAAQQNAHSAAGVAAAGHAAEVQEIRAAVAGRDPDLLAKIIAQAGSESITIARQAIRQALATARAAQAVQVAIAQVAVTGIGGEATGHGGGYTAVESNPAIGQLGDMAAGLANDVTAGPGANVYNSGSDVAGAAVGSPAERAAAAAQAEAIRKQGQIAKARADIVAAHAAMDAAKGGSVEYYNALGQLYQAQQELAQAVVAYKQNLYLLGHDITDPLVQARAAAKAAAATLRNDKGSGAAADQIAADKVALEQAQASAESTAFQQRLNSVQTADELGRISHQKYLNYLQHEHDRLEAVKHRTFQQQQELDQVDQLLKSANDALQGEWNFGDIKLPTPYEVQRRVQEIYGNAGNKGAGSDAFLPTNALGQIHGVTNNNNVYINGAEIGAIRKVLHELLGDRATTSTTAARHR